MGIEELARKFIEKVNASHTPEYRRVKITFFLSAPVLLSHPWVHFDSLLQHFHLMYILGQDYFLLWEKKVPFFHYVRKAMKEGVWLEKEKLRIIRTEKALPFASISFFDSDMQYATKLYKRFEDRFFPRTKRKKIYRGMGHFKDYMITQIYVACSEVHFYADADPIWLERLLPMVAGIGDNVRIGFGTARDFTIEETDVHPVVHEGKAMRPIPLHLCERTPNTEVIQLAWKSPYWDKKNVAPCVVPRSEVKVPWIESGVKPS